MITSGNNDRSKSTSLKVLETVLSHLKLTKGLIVNFRVMRDGKKVDFT